MTNEMLTVTEAANRIETGAVMVIAGAEELLEQLPRGNWIGGTTVYFVTDQGGEVVRDRLFCTTFPQATGAIPRHVGVSDLPGIASGYQVGGFTMIMIPAFSIAHSEFAVEGQGYPDLFNQPLAGWVTGVHLDELGTRAPMVFDGLTGKGFDEGAVLLHVALPEGATVELDILNIFAQGDQPELTFKFKEGGFSAKTVEVEGREVGLADYIKEKNIDIRLPFVANYSGALVNVSVQSVDDVTGEVKFYAPVVAGMEYKLARALGSYSQAFAKVSEAGTVAQCSCNCILNYLYGELEGKKTGGFTGPVTFGEIAYILLNQTLVRLDIDTAA